MIVSRLFGKAGRGLAVAAAILAVIGLATVPRPADVRGGGRGRRPCGGGGGGGGGAIGPGAAVGLGLGAFTLIIRRRRQLTRRVPAHLNRVIRLRPAGQAATSPDN